MIELVWDRSLGTDCVHRFEFSRQTFLPRFQENVLQKKRVREEEPKNHGEQAKIVWYCW
jgi:hypothetical protein